MLINNEKQSLCRSNLVDQAIPQALRADRMHAPGVRKIIAAASAETIEAIIKDAKNNDAAARQLFVKHLMLRHRFVAEPVDLSPAKDAAKAQAQIGMLDEHGGARRA